GPNHKQVANIADFICTQYRNLKQYGKAAEYSRRALAVREKLWEGQDKRLCEPLERVAMISIQAKQYDQAISYARRLQALGKKCNCPVATGKGVRLEKWALTMKARTISQSAR